MTTQRKNTPRKVRAKSIHNIYIAIVFNLDNTIVTSQYKKHKLADYDDVFFVNILGTKRIRVS